MLLNPLIILQVRYRWSSGHTAKRYFKMGRRFLYTVQFGRGDVDTHSGKPVYTSELQSKSSCDLAVVFTSLKYMHQRSTWTNFSRRWLSLSDQHWWSTLSFRSSMWLILWCQTSVSYCIGYHWLVLKLGYVRVGKLWPNLALEKKEETFPVTVSWFVCSKALYLDLQLLPYAK